MEETMTEKREEKVLNDATVCFLYRDGEILLGLKTQKIGKGKRNGYGGGVEDESVLECAIRELKEETGGIITLPEHLEKIAIVHFHNTKSNGETFVCKVHFYLVHTWEGEIKDTEEMIDPKWFSIENLPLDEMMPADRQWLPIALSGKKIIAKAYLSPFQEKSLGDVEIEYVDSFDE
jgi:8-oxo-dGTP pyrophosphatase MutT (NUDIX family)